MLLYDCFMYFDEDVMLDLRLHTLEKYVDIFVIAEATKDHAGREKKLNFDHKHFSKFKDKIKYLVIDDLPIHVKSTKKNWASNHLRDQYQRNSLEQGFKSCDENDLIMISDIDEIPDPLKLTEFKIENRYACFIQKNFQSKLNLLNITDKNWMGTKICQKKYLKSPQWLRNIKTKKKPFWKDMPDIKITKIVICDKVGRRSEHPLYGGRDYVLIGNSQDHKHDLPPSTVVTIDTHRDGAPSEFVA